VDLFYLFFGNNIFELIVTKSNEYYMAKFGINVAISTEEVRVFVAILILSSFAPSSEGQQQPASETALGFMDQSPWLQAW
jgi:hypothetical protein